MASTLIGKQAVVIGAGMGGLTAAGALADRFDQVVVLERDTLPSEPAYRAGTPQARHAHALLLSGQRALSELFPGFEEDLARAGAVPLRADLDIRMERPGYDPFPQRDLAALPLVKAPQHLARAGVLILLAGVLAAVPAAAQEPGSVSVAIDGTTIKLRTVTYRPTGDGPFPTLIFHHGSGSFERPYDPKVVAQWFVVRGWTVIAPSRRGRGGSEGVDEEGSTCTESAAREGADRALRDIEAVTPALIAQTFVDRSRIAIGGQSRGGILSVAWSGKHPEVRAVVNFVGGWMDSRICRYGSAINQSLLKRGVAWGQPSLWLYGDNDLFYPLEHTRANFAAFQAAGGKGEWHDYKPPEEGLNGHQIGQAPQLWTADMEAYLAERGLSSKDGN